MTCPSNRRIGVFALVILAIQPWDSLVVDAAGEGWFQKLQLSWKNRVDDGASSAITAAAALTYLDHANAIFLPPYGGGSGGRDGGRVLAQDEEETLSMKVAEPLASAGVDPSRDEPLMGDLNLLSQMLSDLVNHEDHAAHDLYEHFRQLGLERAQAIDNAKPLQQMVASAERLTAKEAVGVVRIFSIMLNLVNAAEVHHRFRNLRKYALADGNDSEDPLPNIEDSIRGTINALLRSNGATPEQIFNQLLKQKVEIVLTAHPTQVQRKSLLKKYREVTENLNLLERSDLDGYGRAETKKTLQRVINSIWGADEIRRQKPTPQQEAAAGSAIVESVLWDAVPGYLRKLNEQCRMSLGKSLPIDRSPIHFASWIGGDRDGNPNVTPLVTEEVALQQRLRAARLLIRDLYSLQADLAISSRFSPELEALAFSIPESRHYTELYRRVIGHLLQRLIKAARQYEAQIAKLTSNAAEQTTGVEEIMMMDHGWQNVEPMYETEELLRPLLIIHDSLVQTGFELVADGLLVDIIRRLTVFGLSFLRLDIREESTRHTMALDAITKYLGLGSYEEWSEDARLSWLVSELANRRPLIRIDSIADCGFEPDVVKTLETFHTASKLHRSDLGAYVISQAQTASDVLAVMLLQKQFGMTPENGKMMRVVPLFETLADLTNAPDVLNTLFSISSYKGAVNGKQEVMVGYSDSAKDAGRLAACWAQYNSQELMAQCAASHDIELTFFHGKGGTVGRGGNPSVYRAIMSHPPATINGRFRVTEQGEMITQNFGATSIAERTLDTYTAAVCREAFAKHVNPSPEWREQMAKISERSCAGYRHLVREEPRFVPYFRQATPEVELGSLNIGSRPAKRKPKGGIESLRAIPWTFAWAQTRMHLSAWLGVSDGLKHPDENELKIMRDMYKQWPWFRETIDLICMILSKTDFSISANYDNKLVDGKDERILGNEVREKLVQTRQAVLDVTESKDYAGSHVALMRASAGIRHPYVDPVNVIQAEILKRVRALDARDENDLTAEELEELETLRDAVVISVNAIAQGMRNSG
ncbi:hypothetical protein ACA910_014256 [Epithemia clementina (nom. ined.)]